MEGVRRARQQVLSFLLRHRRIYSGGGHWTRKHRLRLSAQRFDHPARQIAFEELVQAVETQARRDRLAKQMQELAPSWSLSLPQPIKDIAGRLEARLCARHRRLVREGQARQRRQCRHRPRTRRLRLGNRHQRACPARLNKTRRHRKGGGSDTTVIDTTVIDIAAHRRRRRLGWAIL
jgi:hypothetical protein